MQQAHALRMISKNSAKYTDPYKKRIGVQAIIANKNSLSSCSDSRGKEDVNVICI